MTRTKLGILLALGLGIFFMAGCAKKTAKINPAPKALVPRSIACSMTWKGGGFGVNKIDVTLEPSTPSPDGHEKMIITSIDVPSGPVPAKAEELVSRSSFSTVISVEKETKYTLKITVPPGWKATPSEYKISQDIKNADFTLEKIAK